MPALRLVAGVAVVAAIAACTDLSINPAYNDIQAVITDPSFSREIMPVLRQTCAGSSGCHFGPGAQKGLRLDTDSAAYASMVNVAATYVPGVVPIMRVMPNFAESSFVYLVLRDSLSVRLGYYRMPLSQYQLPYETRETIKNWINKGALNN